MRKIFALVVIALAALAVSASGVSASSSSIVIPFEKHAVGPGHYVGTAGDGGTIEMQVSDSRFTGGDPETSDHWVQHFKATLRLTVGGQSLTATDTLRTSLAGSQSGITVTPNAATHLGLSAPSSSAASLAFTVTVTVLDAYGNTVSGYRGAIHFTSSDAAAYLPADYTFVAADNGVHAFTNGVTLNTVGAQTVTATDKVTSSTAGNAAVTVTPATLPVAPTNLTATVISSNQINLSWTDNSNNETGFKIWRSLDGKNWTLIAIVGVNVTSYSDTGLASRTFYYYRVQATNSAGDSAYSLVVKKRTL